MAHPAALAAGRAMAAGLSTGGAGPLPVGSEPNYSNEREGGDDVARELAEQTRADEGRQRREFLAKMAEHGLETKSGPRPQSRRRERERERERDDDLDPEDDDEEEETGTAYDTEDDEPRRPASKRLRKAVAFAEQQGLSQRAIEAMTDQELLVWARKQSRRESRLNRAPKGTAREGSERSSPQAGDVEQQVESILNLPSEDVLKGHAKKLADARGWSDEDADALADFGKGLLESVKLALEPALRPVLRGQEDREATALEDERARLEERFPELSDDEVFDEVSSTAKWLVEQGRAKNLSAALRKAVALEFDDDDFIAARVQSEIESRTSQSRRHGRPMVPRQMRQRSPMSEEDRQTSGMKAVFDTLLTGGTRAQARAAYKRRTRA